MKPALTVERLTVARRDDFLRFFDHERGPAFADNPGWAKCYCHFYHVPKAIRWDSLDGAANRTAMAARIDASEMDGFLAYAGGEVVGWLNAQPQHKLPHCAARMGIAAPPRDVAPSEAAAVVCFVIAPSWRRRGVARALLSAALSSFAARGIRVVDAFPFKDRMSAAGPPQGAHCTPSGGSAAAEAASVGAQHTSAAPTDHYHGPKALFVEAGFDVLADHKDLTVMRKRLAQPA